MTTHQNWFRDGAVDSMQCMRDVFHEIVDRVLKRRVPDELAVMRPQGNIQLRQESLWGGGGGTVLGP
eukprot:5618502-Amphidinium_carterae.1